MDTHDVLNTPQDSIQYLEYKIILQAEHFQTAQAFVDFWKIVRHTAKKFDVKVKEAENAFQSNVREVLFFDTSDFALYKNHFIVRLRTHYKDGWPQGIPELTVKFRHPGFEEAAAVDVRPATPGGSAKIKFKEAEVPGHFVLVDDAPGTQSDFVPSAQGSFAAADGLADFDEVFLRGLEEFFSFAGAGEGQQGVATDNEAFAGKIGTLDFGEVFFRRRGIVRSGRCGRGRRSGWSAGR